jgi:hypothetical protein
LHAACFLPQSASPATTDATVFTFTWGPLTRYLFLKNIEHKAMASNLDIGMCYLYSPLPPSAAMCQKSQNKLLGCVLHKAYIRHGGCQGFVSLAITLT